MRELVLLSCVLTGCNASQLRPVFFDAGSEAIQCLPANQLTERGSLVSDVTSAGHSSILVLYGAERELVTYDSAFNVVKSVSFERDGPRGVAEPVSAATDGDLFYVADEKRLVVKLFDDAGRDKGTVRLDFIPRRLRSAGHSVVLTPFVAGKHPPSLLYELRGGRPVSRAIPPAHYDDGGLNALANMSALATFDDGRIVVLHETIVPFGYSLSLRNASSSAHLFAVPLPRSQQTMVNRLPPTPLTDRSVADILTVALTAAPDPGSGHLYYLTRSGRKIDGWWEKMIVELDAKLNYVRSAPLGHVRALHMAFVAARRSLLIADDMTGWFECKL